MLLVDAANVIGSRPTGWWKDRSGASRTFVAVLRRAVGCGLVTGPVAVVLEGRARAGAPTGTADGVTVHHAPGSGDDLLVALAADGGGPETVLVSADRALRHRVQSLGATVVGPGWLLDRLDRIDGPDTARSADP